MRRNTVKHSRANGADSSARAVFTPGYVFLLALMAVALRLLNLPT